MYKRQGDKVIVGGSVDVYERDGRYQMYAKEITLEGAGAVSYTHLFSTDPAGESNGRDTD